MNRGKIIAEGLSQAGRSDLTSNAREWLNDYLEDIYRSQDLQWLIKVDKITVTQDFPIPQDYRAMKSLSLYDNKLDIEEIGVDEFLLLPPTQGVPMKVYVDEQAGVMRFWPNIINAAPANLAYFYIPELPDPTDPTSDLTTPVWKLPYSVLKKAIYVKALEYNDDVRYEAESKALDIAFAKAKMNNHDMRAGKHRFSLGKSFKKRF